MVAFAVAMQPAAPRNACKNSAKSGSPYRFVRPFGLDALARPYSSATAVRRSFPAHGKNARQRPRLSRREAFGAVPTVTRRCPRARSRRPSQSLRLGQSRPAATIRCALARPSGERPAPATGPQNSASAGVLKRPRAFAPEMAGAKFVGSGKTRLACIERQLDG